MQDTVLLLHTRRLVTHLRLDMLQRHLLGMLHPRREGMALLRPDTLRQRPLDTVRRRQRHHRPEAGIRRLAGTVPHQHLAATLHPPPLAATLHRLLLAAMPHHLQQITAPRLQPPPGATAHLRHQRRTNSSLQRGVLHLHSSDKATANNTLEVLPHQAVLKPRIPLAMLHIKYRIARLKNYHSNSIHYFFSC